MECGLAVVGENVISTLLGILTDELDVPMVQEFARKERVHSHLKRWETILLKIQAVLQHAEERQFTDRRVKIWLDELKELAYDAEDALDDFSTEVLRQKLQQQKSQSFTGKIRKYFSSFFDQISFNYRMASRIKEITERLEVVVRQKEALGLTESLGGSRNDVLGRIASTSLVNESLVFGRETDKDIILNELVFGEYESRDGGISVIPIVGMGGLGKTTLAQLIYNDEKVETFFKLRAWVCVSEEFDVVRVMKSLLESLTSEACNVNDLNKLQVTVKEKLSNQRFLVVLDDVWNENYNDWLVLRSPFEAGCPESRIIVTTRNQGVASVMGTISSYCLKEMWPEDCLSLFAQHALGSSNFDDYPHLKDIGGAIVERCKGLPLAVKTLAGLLRSKIEYHEWEGILNSMIWDLPEENSPILPALRLSYHHLPFHLKQCFAYCSIFPKDYEFDKAELVQLWIAEGFIHQPKGMKQVEDLGSDYFNDLLSRSFFQQSSVKRSSCYMMHDLINDLAQSVAGGFCFRLEDKLKSNGQCFVTNRARHSSFIRQKYDVLPKFEFFYRAQCLRTFLALPVSMPDPEVECYLTNTVFQDLLPKLRCLRVLSLSGYCIHVLPNSIGDLNHLRYLNLSRTRIKFLPESLGALCNLWSLNLSGCKELERLPQEMGNLISLRYLDISDTDKLREMPLDIGHLINLKQLSKFFVGECTGPRISELKGLSHLQGQLYLSELKNVAGIRDVRVANLKQKNGLGELIMEWSNARNDFESKVDETDVLDMLEPHQNLKKLSILCYKGSKLPYWIENPSFVNMVRLKLCDCPKLTSLPSLGRLPSLEDLHIEGTTEVRFVDSEFYGTASSEDKAFPSLVTLTFVEMLKWEKWSQPQGFEDSRKNFPHLNELVMRNCPNLVGNIPNLLTSLGKLSICGCPNLAASGLSFPSLRELNLEQCNERFLAGFRNLTPLTRLKIESISNLSCLPEGFTCLVWLEVLEIEDCGGLTSLWQKGSRLENLCSLKRLAIMKCSNLWCLIDDEDELPLGLEYLEIEDCANLVKLPNGLGKLSSLKELSVKWCPKLISFPNIQLPSMLKNLAILGCDSLESLPEGLLHNDNSSTAKCHLENLEVVGCPSLVLFPTGELPATLKQLEIWDCMQLKCIPEMLLQNNQSLEFIRIGNCNLNALPRCLYRFNNLTELHVNNCLSLEFFPDRGLPISNLRLFLISNCVNLKSLPSRMHDLICLKYLTLFGCPTVESYPEGGFPPNLLSLSVWDCKQLMQHFPKWRLDKLTSLKVLMVGDLDIISFPEESTIPPTLVHLRVQSLPNLEDLSKGLQDLVFLEALDVWHCPKLQYLPKDDLPMRLGVLHIINCPLLEKKCLKEKGEYWPMISQLPRVRVNYVDIIS